MASEKVIDKIKSAPSRAGVYIFKSEDKIIYIGKARSLKNRLNSYLGAWNKGRVYEKAYKIMEQADDLDYILVGSEDEALILEANMIYQHKPKYNVSLKDSNFYPFILITDETYPRVTMTRERSVSGKYFGPYTNAGFVRDLLDLVGRIFKVRQCSRSMERVTRPCFDYHLKRCTAPCARLVDPKSYSKQVEELISFLSGEVEQVRSKLVRLMDEQARSLTFESAAKTRDVVAKLDKLFPSRSVILSEKRNVDAICYSGNIVLVLRVIQGLLVSKLVFEATDEVDLEEIVEELYERRKYPTPEFVLVEKVEELDLEEPLVKTPQTEDEGALLELCRMNLVEELKNRALTAEALESVREMLGLGKTPRFVEGVDIAHTAGKETVGAVVSFIDGKPFKSGYRIYKLSTTGGDDFGAIKELLTRRYSKHPLPDLLFIDGGEPQLRAAQEALKTLGLTVDIVGIAKEEETVITPGHRFDFPHDNPVLRFLAQIRDEAHRFANARHRRIKSKEDMLSLLDGIEGIGPKRKRLLLRYFGGISGLVNASEDEIARLLKNSTLARRIKEVLGGGRK